MRPQEAIYLYNVLKKYSPGELSPCINIGSSTKRFREYTKPHIAKYVTDPLTARGIKLINFDLKEGDGVDIVGDIFDERVFSQLRKLKAKSLICANILEHVSNRELFAKRCSSLLGTGGLILVTVPYSFPYHRDPIDTLYRPTPEDIFNLFPGFIMEDGSIIVDSRYIDDLKKYGIMRSLLRLCRLFLPIYKPISWLSHVHRLLWLFRPYKVSCVVLRKRLL